MKTGILRILDANLNRSREGLRVCEDIARFILNSSHLASQFRSVRHSIVEVSKALPIDPTQLLKARDSDQDVGKAFGLIVKRENWQDVFRANIQRAEEAIRVLEELSIIISRKSASSFQKIRFRLYSLEKRVIEPRVIYHPRQRSSGKKIRR